MPRNISFALTKEQVKNRTKTVTRRDGWWNLTGGEILNAVEKSQGLKKGEKVKVICQIRVIRSETERLNCITQEECVKEGFPNMTPEQFIKMFCKSHKEITEYDHVNRIEFEYV
jgi:hypothetical protein